MSTPIENYRNYLGRNYQDMKLPKDKPYGIIKLSKGYEFGFHVRKDHISVHFISDGSHDPEAVISFIEENGIGEKTYGDGLAADVFQGKKNANVVRCEVHIPFESVNELRKPTLRKLSQHVFNELYNDFENIDQLESSKGESNLNVEKESSTPKVGRKWLTNNCEDAGECLLKTDAFKPVDGYGEMIEKINALYEDNRYEPNDTLFTYKQYDDEIVMWGSTYLLEIHENIDQDELYDLEEDEIKEQLKNDGIPEYLWDQVLEMFYEGSCPVGDIIELMVVPNQSVNVQITDTQYGNSEYTIDS